MDLIQTKVQTEMALSQIRIAEEDCKQERRLQRKLQFLQQKSFLAEEECERKKSQCDLLSIDESGNIRIQTTNLRIDANARKVVNFTHPEITILERMENETEKIYLFTCNMVDDLRYAMFDYTKCGSPTYVLKKWAAIGAEIFAPTLAVKKQYALQLLALLIHNANRRKKLPDRRGWYVDENDEIKFFQGRWTWEEALRCVK